MGVATLVAALSLSAEEFQQNELRLQQLTPERIASVEAKLRIKLPPDQRRHPSEPLPRLLDAADREVFDRSRGMIRVDGHCDDEGFAGKTGEALVEHIRSAPYECVNRLFQDAPGSIRFAAFCAQNMIDVATAVVPLATGYDATNASNLTELFVFLRAGFFVAFYEPDDLDWSGHTEAIGRAAAAALDAFVDNRHFFDETGEHADVLSEAVFLMDAAEQQARYLPTAKSWLRRWGPHLGDSNFDAVIFGYQFLLFRGHQRQAFRDATATDIELMHLLRDLALEDWMLDTSVEYLAGNAGQELSRFLAYRDAPVYPEAQAGVKRILDRYDSIGEGRSVWVATIGAILRYDDCAKYDICGVDQEVEAATLNVEHACSDSVLIRSQALPREQLVHACALLERQELEFHNLMRTGGMPVADDYNARLEIVVFQDSANYETYSNLFFGNNTNNGGIYLEGDPGDPSNTARFIAYVATWLEDEPIWNLEHEQVHYLDGRYDLYGSFSDLRVDSHKTVWWLEGLAEYISIGNANATAVEVGRDGALSLGKVFAVTYADHPRFVYRWSYLAVRFLFERHRDEVDVFLNHFRAGDYDAYLAYLDRTFATAYQGEWESWLAEVAVTVAGTPGLVGLPRALTVGEETSTSYEVALATPPSGDVTVEVGAPENLSVDRTALTFSTADWNQAQTVVVTAAADDNALDDALVLTHAAFGGGYDSARALVRVTVLDNAPAVSFANARVSAREGGSVTLTVRVGKTLDEPATIGYVIGADDDPATSDADSDDHDGADGAVTIAAGASEATFEIGIHDDSDIDAARETFVVSIEPSAFRKFKPGIVGATVVIEEGVCDRSPAIRDALRDSLDCAEVTDVDLADVYHLDLSGRLNGEPRAGDLSGLTGLADIRLNANRLTRLPRGLFSDLASLRVLDLSNNELAYLPDDIFAGLSDLKRLYLLNNPGTPFTLTPRWLRTDVGDAGAPESATIVATVAEGAPSAMEMGISASNGRLSADSVLIPAGATRSAPVSVERIGAGATRVAFEGAPAVPGHRCGTHAGEGFSCFEGIDTAAGETLVLFANLPPPVRVPEALRGADVAAIDLDGLFGVAPGEARMYAAESGDPALATVRIDGDLLIVAANDDDVWGDVTITVTLTRSDGSTRTWAFTVAIRPRAASEASVNLFPAAFRGKREGFVRVVNHSDKAGEVEILAVDDTGEFRPAVNLALGARAAAHFNSNDLEQGNAGKGLSGGIGAGVGDWRLQITSDLNVEVLSYIRAEDGFLTAMHDAVRFAGNRAVVPVFNPGSNANQRSLLRLVNPGTETADIAIVGIDDNGDSPGGEVQFSLRPGGVRTFGSAELETGGAGFRGSLGDGRGKWRLVVTSNHRIVAMNVLESPAGHLTNLSTSPGRHRP